MVTVFPEYFKKRRYNLQQDRNIVGVGSDNLKDHWFTIIVKFLDEGTHRFIIDSRSPEAEDCGDGRHDKAEATVASSFDFVPVTSRNLILLSGS